MNKYIVKFARGPKQGYNLYNAEQKKGVVYFAEDTKEILANGITYGIDLTDSDLSLLAKVEMTSIGTLIFTKSNGSTTTISIPLATQSSDGLFSKEDKKTLDDVPSIYATKNELSDAISRIYRFKGTKQYFTDLPQEDQVIGDAYNILNGFDLDGKHYNAGTNVAWDGQNWDPLGGNSDSYTKLEADDLFVAWTLENEIKVIKLPKGSRLVATAEDNSSVNLVKLNIAGVEEYVEVGDVTRKIQLNSLGRPVIVLPDNNEKLAYLSDIGNIDLSEYGVNSKILYLPELTQEFIDENGEGDNFNGAPVTSANKPSIGEEIIAVIYADDLLNKHIDWFTPNTVMPNVVYAAIQGLREEYLQMFAWEEVQP